MGKIYWIIICLYFLVIPTGIAQEQHIAQTHTISIPDGLLSPAISAVYEDSRGVVWIGTNCGLNSYDGINLIAYTKKGNGLFGDHIIDIKEDIHGAIWVRCSSQFSTIDQISVLNPSTQTAQPLKKYTDFSDDFNSDFSKYRIHGVIQNSDGSIWIILSGLKVYEYNGTEIKFLCTIPSQTNFWQKVSAEEVVYATQYPNKSSSLIFYNHRTAEVIDSITLLSLATTIQHSLSVVADTVFWIDLDYKSSTILFYAKVKNAPIQLLNKKQWTFSAITSIKQNDQHYYIGNEKVNVVFNKKGHHYKTIYSKDKLHFPSTTFMDKKGGIWFKDSEKEALRYIRYQTSPFRTYDLSDGNPLKHFRGGRGICKIQDSLLLVASVIRYKEQKNDQGVIIKGFYSYTSYNNQKGIIYAGIKDLQFWDYNLNILKTYTYAKETAISSHWSIMEDHTGIIWIGTHKGLSHLDTFKQALVQDTSYNGLNALQNSIVYHIHDAKDHLYLCSSSGLYLWDKNHGAEALYFKGQNILHLHEDKDGVFWLATKGDGLIRFNPKTKEHRALTTADGLSNNVLYAVYEDAYNTLWMSSNWGIMALDKNTEVVTNYTKENGLLDNEFNTLSHHKDKEGNIYFGSQKGIVIFHPKNFQTDEETFLLKITKVNKIISDTEERESILRAVKRTNKIDLHPTDKGFELNVALLDYRNPKLHQYAYLIEGLNKNWQYQLSPNIVEKNISYGHYKIRVKVKGLSGKWIELEQPIALSVYRPFYLQTWFIVLAILVGIFAVFLLIKTRTQQLVARQRELEEVVQIRTKKIAQQAEDLKAMDEVKSRFFANISHELRTPLTLILGPISALLNRYKKEDIDKTEIKKSLTHIKKNGENLLNLVEEILDLSKMEAQKLDLYEEPVLLELYLHHIYTAFEKQAKYLGIDYKLHLKLSEDLWILLDKNKVEKVLNNLLSNALKFTPSGQQLDFSIVEHSAQIEFIVKDTGLGIHPNDLPNIFDRFYQSKQPNLPAQGGTGIGLALVAEFTRLMGGTVDVNSKLNKGTTFSVLLPKQIIQLSTEEQAALLPALLPEIVEEQETAPTVLEDEKATLLIVEDHAEMRDFICSILEQDYNIITATNGYEGLTALEEADKSIDLILSDVMMPQMDGFTMLAKIKASEQWRFIPMIMLTARAAEEDKLQALTVGVDDYLTKPFSVDELKIRVANLLRNSIDRKLWIKAQEDVVSAEDPAEEASIQDSDLTWVKELEQLMQNEIENDAFGVAELAKRMYLSEGHLRRRLKQLTGLTPSKMFATVRLNTARTYLEKKQFRTVKEIAFSVGFQTVEGFSKAYKKHFGKLPSEYLS